MPEDRFVPYETLDDEQIVPIMSSRSEAPDTQTRETVEDRVHADR